MHLTGTTALFTPIHLVVFSSLLLCLKLVYVLFCVKNIFSISVSLPYQCVAVRVDFELLICWLGLILLDYVS